MASNNRREESPSRNLRPMMGELFLISDRRKLQRLFLQAGGFLLIFLAATWLRHIAPRPDPILQGYLQLTTGLFALCLRLFRSSGFKARKIAFP